MNTIQAFLNAQASAGKESKVFDWDKAATMIREYGVKEASAGLSEDWEWTGGKILSDGKPVPRNETYTFLASNWATPAIRFL